MNIFASEDFVGENEVFETVIDLKKWDKATND